MKDYIFTLGVALAKIEKDDDGEKIVRAFDEHVKKHYAEFGSKDIWDLLKTLSEKMKNVKTVQLPPRDMKSGDYYEKIVQEGDVACQANIVKGSYVCALYDNTFKDFKKIMLILPKSPTDYSQYDVTVPKEIKNSFQGHRYIGDGDIYRIMLDTSHYFEKLKNSKGEHYSGLRDFITSVYYSV